LLAAAITLVWRRLTGALENPLPWQAMLSAGILLSAAALVARRCAVGRISNPSTRDGTDWNSVLLFSGGPILSRLLTSVGVVSLAVALTVSGTPLDATLALWIPIAVEEFWAWGGRVRRIWPRALLGTSGRAVEEDLATRHPPPVPRHPFHHVADDVVVQRQIRSRAADGTETLRGWLRAAVAPGQRSASVHVAFCPPFPRTPRVLVEQREGPPTRIKTVQVLPHGARFDLKLAQPSESAAHIVLEFSAEEAEGV
jgi:hypothetical protein